MHHFLCRKIIAHWQIAVLPPYSPPLNSLGYGIWGVLQAKDHATAKQNGLFKANHLATAGGQSEAICMAKLPLAQAALGKDCCC
jgi:hypothetical protein